MVAGCRVDARLAELVAPSTEDVRPASEQWRARLAAGAASASGLIPWRWPCGVSRGRGSTLWMDRPWTAAFEAHMLARASGLSQECFEEVTTATGNLTGLMKAFLGEQFDETVGIDKNGKPTRVAREIAEGGVFPFGGHRGYGLNLAIQALGLIARRRYRRRAYYDPIRITSR